MTFKWTALGMIDSTSSKKKKFPKFYGKMLKQVTKNIDSDVSTFS